ncbi:MAG: thioredoxin family protein [Planctomycetota bacterium]|jgi:hypothetical protein
MDDASVDRLVREHYERRRPPAGRLAGWTAVFEDEPERVRTRRRAVLALAACALVSAVLGAALTFALIRPAVPTSPAAPDVDLIVVQMHADWCPPSRVIATRLAEVREAIDHGNVLFLRLDLTDDARLRQAELTMDALGFADIWRNQRGVTGELLLIDTQRRLVLDKLSPADDVPQMIVRLAEAVDRTSG